MVHQIWNTYPEIERGLEEVKSIILSEMMVLHPAVTSKIVEYVEAPGKYLRAGLCLLFAQMTEGKISRSKLYFAAHLEVLHLATLIHDDVIDGADKRRGVTAAHQQFSNRIAIYTGDYLLAYSGRLLGKGLRFLDVTQDDLNLGNDKLMETILRGELSQLINQFDANITMKAYLKQIQGKTAFLFGLSCQLGSFVPGQSKKESQLAFRAGQALGMAFQIRDDLIDYQLEVEESGKPRLQDIQNGIYTAPLLFAMQEDNSIRQLLQSYIQSPNQEDLEVITERLFATNALAKTEGLLTAYLKKMRSYLDRLDQSSIQPLESVVKTVFSQYF
ncbi:TPA: polyprenyl synthetase family protein [Streptococcus suis]|uniref:polyprenyl synthetase family protein n=1 Tax=Streptococcus suis TaxID=1307 RepID=UPI000CF587EB|nr:polyprenyl synthetase family protein [Streptococcus suis]MCK3890494.1 polyprenyl synthetase family protein [Streptococcus suis]MDW8732567.1 polyprenyl synthetase family protein [Streptococcus suis]NQM01021.1 polyprenyl synthetase family protein [Streptococcus suis]NQM35251.1 polyprenyl synthetase family protein [Streptococcus suis]HEL2571184.1 polyprenyl synthetase family protein [Streptococcus suis]